MGSIPYLNCLHLLLATVLLSTTALGQQGSGYIYPSSGFPQFNPAAWNVAYKLTLRNVPASYSSKELLQSLRFPNTMLANIQLPQDCSMGGFDSANPSSAALGSCFSKQSSPATIDYWVKLPGLALVSGNCYCYSLDLFQGGFCYPGTKNGAVHKYRQKMTCKALAEGVSSDGGQAVSRQQALSGQPSSGHYIVIMARPESCIKGHCYVADFHAMRKDSSGTWSWKHPGMPATNRDLFGALVTDPEAAALQGSYQVCGYFQVEPQKMLHVDSGSRKEPGPLPVNPALDKFKAIPGVTVEITPLTYNPATDMAVNKVSQQLLEEDTAWERLKGSEQYRAWRVREKQALEVIPRGVVNDMAGGSSSSSSPESGNRSPKRHLSSRRLLDPGD